MVHLYPGSLARCSCRLDLSLGIKKDSAWQLDPDGTRGWAQDCCGKPSGLPNNLEWF